MLLFRVIVAAKGVVRYDVDYYFYAMRRNSDLHGLCDTNINVTYIAISCEVYRCM